MAQDWQPAWTTEVRIESGEYYSLLARDASHLQLFVEQCCSSLCDMVNEAVMTKTMKFDLPALIWERR